MDVHDAAKQGNMAELELVAEYAPERINEARDGGWTPLHYAASMREDAVSFLLSAGANVNQTDNNGSTPLVCAAAYSQEAAVSFLLNAGANVNQTKNNGKTALSCARNARVRQLLRDAGGHR